MVERYVKTIEEHPRKVALTYQRDWDEWLPIFLLAFPSINPRDHRRDACQHGLWEMLPQKRNSQ